MAGCERAAVVVEKGCFGGQYGRGCENKKILAQKRMAFENSTDGLVQIESFCL